MKAGRTADLDGPQMRRVREAVRLVNDGRAEVGGVKRGIVRSRRPYRTYLGELPALLDRAERDGRAVIRPSPAQLVAVRDLIHPAVADHRYGHAE